MDEHGLPALESSHWQPLSSPKSHGFFTIAHDMHAALSDPLQYSSLHETIHGSMATLRGHEVFIASSGIARGRYKK